MQVLCQLIQLKQKRFRGKMFKLERNLKAMRWWLTSFISTFRRQNQADLDGFKASLVYSLLAPGKAPKQQQNAVLKNKIKTSKQTEREKDV